MKCDRQQYQFCEIIAKAFHAHHAGFEMKSQMQLHRTVTKLLALALVIFIPVACQRAKKDKTVLLEGAFPVDPLFQKFHNQLGGAEILGPAISPVFQDGDSVYQYTVNALMVFDPRSGKDDQRYLAPLGRDVSVFEIPGALPEEENLTVVDGYVIYDKFVPLFLTLGGKQVVGKPLTGVHKNVEKNRYEQYFANVGFYWFEGDPVDEVFLLAYGAWKCNRSCRLAPPLNSRLNLPLETAAPFVKMSALHGIEFTGFALTPPYIVADNKLEQIYENLIMRVDVSTPEIVQLLRLPEMVGITRDVLLPAAEAEDGLNFYPVQGDLGYYIPEYFAEYIRRHGGFEFVGEPITQPAQLENEYSRQCFTNLCLRAEVGTEGVIQVAPESLGYQYRDVHYKPDLNAAFSDQNVDVTIQPWEGLPMVSPDQEQEIGVAVFSGNAPLVNIEPEVELLLPDGKRVHYEMPLTDENGESRIVVAPLHLENGTLIPYKVCVTSLKGQRFCLVDSYLIWKADFRTITPRITPENTSYLPILLKNIDAYIPAVLDSFRTYLPFVADP